MTKPLDLDKILFIAQALEVEYQKSLEELAQDDPGMPKDRLFCTDGIARLAEAVSAGFKVERDRLERTAAQALGLYYNPRVPPYDYYYVVDFLYFIKKAFKAEYRQRFKDNAQKGTAEASKHASMSFILKWGETLALIDNLYIVLGGSEHGQT